MQQKIKQLQAKSGDLKGKRKDTSSVSTTLDPLSHLLENEYVELEFQGSKQKDTTKGTSVNTQFCKQSILGKLHSSTKLKLYVVTPFQKSKGLPKIDETYALSKPITTISVPIPQESKVVKNDNVIALGMFRINPFKPARKEKYVPNKVRVNVRTNPITVSQPHVITKKNVNSDSNGLSSTGVDNTAMTRRPQPRSNTKNDGVPFASKSSCIKNKEFELEEYLRNSLLSKNKNHIYVNDMNSRGKKQKANVSNTENQKKQKPTVMKPKKGSPTKDLLHLSLVVFLRSKDKAPEEIKTFLKKIAVLLQAPVIIAISDATWIESMQEQLLQFKRLDVWVLVPPQDDIKPLTLKWLLKNKHDEENTVIQNKNHLVVRRDCQEDGIDFEESFAPVARMEAIRISLAYATHKSFTMFQIDMKIAFLHGTLKEDVYMCQPEGFIDADYLSHVYKLKKALYGLKQATREWYNKLSTFLLLNHFFKGTINPTLFIRCFDNDILVVQVYIDDIIFGSTHPRPDIVHATYLCARYQAKPTQKHLKEVKRIFRYLRGTVNTGLWYTKDSGFELTYFQMLIMHDVKIPSRVIPVETQLTDYGYNFNKIPIYYDSKSAIAISCNSIQHSRTKYIDVRYNFIKEHVEKGMIELYFVKTDYQMADLFTKVAL
nr:retrovirus-related Pol polyprotein from transposon TNT 1-94 [Tanacetum cinerariifolium]